VHMKWLSIAVGICAIAPTILLAVSPIVRAAGTQHTTAATTGKPCAHRNKAAGTIHYADVTFPSTLNPDQTNDPAAQLSMSMMFDDLMRRNNHGGLTAMLLTRVPSVKNGEIRNGGKTIVLQLKPGRRWSNGTEITSRDIWFSWKVGMDRSSGPACAGSCDVISRIDTPSRYVAILHLKRVYASAVPVALPGVEIRSWPGYWKLNDWHAAALRLYGDPSFNFTTANYPTNGPYQVGEFNPGVRIVLHPMKYYDNMTCGGYVQNMIFDQFPNKQAMVSAAARGQTDVTQDYSVADLPLLRKNADAYTLHADPGYIFEHVEFNLDSHYKGKPNPVASSNIRLALALALDKIGLIQQAVGVNRRQALTMVAWTPWLKTPSLVQPFADRSITGQWDPIARRYVLSGSGKAISDAKRLLRTTRWKNGFTLDFYTVEANPVRRVQTGIIQKAWAKLGVKLRIHYQPVSTLLGNWGEGGTLDHGRFQATMFLWFNDPDPDLFKFQLESRFIDRRNKGHSPVNQNYSAISDSLINRSFSTAASTLKSRSRANAYSAIQHEINRKAFWIGLYFAPSLATTDKHIAGFLNNPTTAGVTWNAYRWKAK
jgi:peptide/nickel transport system substrate-binding protein